MNTVLPTLAALAGTCAAVWLTRRTGYVVSWERPNGAWHLTLGWGQMRLYRRRGTLPARRTGLHLSVERRWAPFRPSRSPFDKFYVGLGNLSWAFGQSPPHDQAPGVRYWLASLPLWLVLLTALAGLARAISN